MSDNKKYYYLKLKDTFFDSDAMIVLESMVDGYKYSNILLKLYLRSLKAEGKLMFNERIPYNSTILAQVTRHSIGDVEKAIQIFKELDLIEILDNGAIYITDIQNFIGESSTEADRVREYRKRIGKEKEEISTNVQQKSVQTPVQTSVQMYDKNTPEIEIELESKKYQESYQHQEKEEIKNNNKDVDADDMPSPHDFYQKNIGILNPYVSDSISHWIKDLNEELVIEALKRSVSASNPWRYAETILNNWLRANVSTLDDVEANDIAHNRKGHRGQNKKADDVDKNADTFGMPLVEFSKLNNQEKYFAELMYKANKQLIKPIVSEIKVKDMQKVYNATREEYAKNYTVLDNETFEKYSEFEKANRYN